MKNTLFAIGEALIDFIPNKIGCDFSKVDAFSPKIGGAPANVLGAYAKLGGKTQLITQLGDDPFGHKIAGELAEIGIGLDNVLFTKQANTALAFVSLDDKGNRTFSFYRNPSADMLYTSENLTEDIFDDCFALHFCSVSLVEAPMKEAHKKAIALAKNSGGLISFDPNIRFPLWNDKKDLKRTIDEFLPMADIIKVSDEEIKFITGTEEIDKGCEELLKYAKLVICTCGADGAYAYTGNVKAYSVSKPVVAKDTTGAGDAFMGSFLYGLHRIGFDGNITENKLNMLLRASNEYCGKSVTKYGAIESYPNFINLQ